MDPLKPAGQGPLSNEFYEPLKKMLKKESGVEKTAASEKADGVILSDAAQQVPTTKQEKFLESVKPEILKLDPEDETFVDEATGKMIDGVLIQEYGEHFKRKPAYRQMKRKLTQTILSDPEQREMMEDFLSVMPLASRSSERSDSSEEEDRP